MNRHNCVYWTSKNLHITMEHVLNLPSLMVWYGISVHGIIGPYFFDGNATAESYLQVLEEMRAVLDNDHRICRLWNVILTGWSANPICTCCAQVSRQSLSRLDWATRSRRMACTLSRHHSMRFWCMESPQGLCLQWSSAHIRGFVLVYHWRSRHPQFWPWLP